MSSFNSRNGYDGSGAMQEMIAKIQEVKASPLPGHQRFVVNERGKNLGHAVIDVKMEHAKDLKEKETYVFQARERDSSRNPGHQRQKSASLKAYTCEDKPEDYTGGGGGEFKRDRFGGGGGGSGKGGGRRRFS